MQHAADMTTCYQTRLDAIGTRPPPPVLDLVGDRRQLDPARREREQFADAANVTFGGSSWTTDIGRGETARGGEYNSLPWRLGLLTAGLASSSAGSVAS
ncbi:hypothetical protein [Dactylosporangium sp. CA-233914]|uniref:hypothetical protein n=1 Tax=Dactylosporangium sp. CA-233914 TaxID=3239934 RepID=UPI003D8B1973